MIADAFEKIFERTYSLSTTCDSSVSYLGLSLCSRQISFYSVVQQTLVAIRINCTSRVVIVALGSPSLVSELLMSGTVCQQSMLIFRLLLRSRELYKMLILLHF